MNRFEKVVGRCINISMPIGGVSRKSHDRVLGIGMILGFVIVIIGVLCMRQGVI